MQQRTKDNLETAFAGESQAHMKYLIFADKADNFFEFRLLLKYPHCPGPVFSPVLPCILIKEFFQGLMIQGITQEPVYCREMPLVGKFIIQPPVNLYYLEGPLDNRIGKITTRRGNSTRVPASTNICMPTSLNSFLIIVSSYKGFDNFAEVKGQELMCGFFCMVLIEWVYVVFIKNG